jgi:hypothetical protein
MPSSLLFNECQGSFLGEKRLGMALNTHIQPTPRMRICGAIPLLPLYDFIDRKRTSLTFTTKKPGEVPIWGITA